MLQLIPMRHPGLVLLVFYLCQTGCGEAPPLLDIPPNTWSRIQEEDYGARRFSSFRYAADIDAFVLWGFQAFESWYRGSPES